MSKMKRTISTLAILATLVLPATAGEIPSRSDMLKSLIVVGTYARLCVSPERSYQGQDPHRNETAR